ncbi:hypothetical protein [Actinoplanes palleronii]|nr:hypothetical protein [Actinoplanes palleronii]
MRLFRPVLGMLLLTIGLPALLAGGCLWAALRHRDAGGAFSAELQRLSAPGYAIVVPDVDRLLRDDASFARIGDTELRITALTGTGPAFVGLAPAGDVAGFLRDVPHTEIRGVQVGTGELPITAARIEGVRSLPSAPGRQDFWTQTGGGALRWVPADLPAGYSLVIMNAAGGANLRLNGTVEVRAGWLDSTTWCLLSFGAMLLMSGIAVLATPRRRREVVYVVEPSQVPALMLAIGAPIPLRALGQRDPRLALDALGDGDGPLALRELGQGFAAFAPRARGGAHRPRTLADSPLSRPPALPQFSWPPVQGGGSLPLTPTPSGTTMTAPIQAAPSGTSTGIRPGGITPVVPGALPIPPAASVDAASVDAASVDDASVDAASVGAAGAGHGREEPVASGGVVAEAPSGLLSAAGLAAESPNPAPGRPLSLLGEMPSLASMLTPPGTRPERPARRRLPAPVDLAEFHATAVGAWVAQTAPERARQTQAQAAAALAEAARLRAPISATQPAAEAAAAAVEAVAADEQARQAEAARSESAIEPASAVPSATQTPAEAGPENDTARGTGMDLENGMDLANGAGLEGGINLADSARHEAGGGLEASAVRKGGVWPAPAPRRVVLLTGPNATDWAATGLTRMGGARPAIKATTPDEPAPAIENGAASEAPTEPIENRPNPDALTRPIENRPESASASVAEAAPEGPEPAAILAATERLETEAEDAVTVTGDASPEAGSVSPAVRDVQDGAGATETGQATDAAVPETGQAAGDVTEIEQAAGDVTEIEQAAGELTDIERADDGLAGTEPITEGRTGTGWPGDGGSEAEQAGEPGPETEKRVEPKPPIVPFPTRHPSTPAQPVPAARAAESGRTSIHETEAGPSEVTGAGQTGGGRAEVGQGAADDRTRKASGTNRLPGGGKAAVTPAAENEQAGPARGLTPKQGGERTADAEERPSVHAAEAGAGEPVAEAQAKAAAKSAAKRAEAKRATEPNRPLSRAQDRLAGTVAGRQSTAATGRKVPAAWLKAAESVAARAATKTAGDQTVPDQIASHQTAPEQTAPHQSAGGQTAPEQTAPHQTAGGQTAPEQIVPGRAASGQGEPAADQQAAGEAAAARKPRPRTGSARSAATRSAAENAEPAPTGIEHVEPASAGTAQVLAASAGTAQVEAASAGTAQVEAASGSGNVEIVETGEGAEGGKASRVPSYVEEAAELLGTTAVPERKRRRAPSTRTSARNRPKDIPDES